jgi:hypothetical protein
MVSSSRLGTKPSLSIFHSLITESKENVFRVDMVGHYNASLISIVYTIILNIFQQKERSSETTQLPTGSQLVIFI